MQIQIKQSEIEAAIRQWVSTQGFNLAGKDVTTNFTATRSRETGIIADLVIEDASVPACTGIVTSMPTLNYSMTAPAIDPLETKTYADGVGATGSGPVPETSPEAVPEAALEPMTGGDDTAPEPAANEVVPAAEATTTSLFS